MNEIEEAYNLGVSAATAVLRLGAKAIPPSHGIDADALLEIADKIDELKFADPVAPVGAA